MTTRNRVLVVMFALLLYPAPSFAQGWKLFEETSIKGTIRGSIKTGTVFQTASGNIYEVADFVYLYEYEYSPSVVILRNGPLYKLIIEGIDEALVCRKLNDDDTANAADPNTTTPATVESTITSKFDGLKQGNIYKLANGQIWEQTEPWIWVWIWVMPRVTIYSTSGGYKMKVENIDHAVGVRRLK